MAQTQAAPPPPPPGFVLQDTKGPPPPGFKPQRPDAPPPPPGFVLESEHPDAAAVASFNPAQPGPGVQGSMSAGQIAPPADQALTPAPVAPDAMALEGMSDALPAPGQTLPPNLLQAAGRYGITPQEGEPEEALRRRIFSAWDQANVQPLPIPSPEEEFGLAEPPPLEDTRSFPEREFDARLKTDREIRGGFIEGLKLNKPLGLSPKAREEWRKLGIFPDPEDKGFMAGVLDPAKRAAQATIETGSVIGDLIFRPVNATITAGIKGTVQTARNWGMGESQADSLERELHKVVMLGGVYATGIAPGAVVRTPQMQAGARPAPIRRAEELTGRESADRFARIADKDPRTRTIRRQTRGMKKQLAKLERENNPATEGQRATLRQRIADQSNAELSRYIEIRNEYFDRQVKARTRSRKPQEAPPARPAAANVEPAAADPNTKTVYRGVRHDTDTKSNQPVYVTEEKSLAETHAYGGGRVESYDINTGDLNVYDMGKPSLPLSTNVIDDVGTIPGDVKKLKDAGYNAVIHSRNPFRQGEIVLLDRSVLKKRPDARATTARPAAAAADTAPEPPPGFVLDETPPPGRPPHDFEAAARAFEARKADEAVEAIPKDIRRDLETGTLPALKEELRQLADAGEAEVVAYRNELKGRIAAIEEARRTLDRQKEVHAQAQLQQAEQLPLFDQKQERLLRARARATADRHSQGMPPERRRQLREHAEATVMADAQTAALASARDKIGKPGLSDLTEQSRFTWAERAEQQLFDALAPIKRLGQKVAKKTGEDMGTALKPYREMRLLAGIMGVLEAVHKRGSIMLKKDGSIGFKGRSFHEAFEPIADNLEHGLLYFVGRRAQELHARGIKTPFTREEVYAMLDIARTYPAARQAFTRWQEFNKDILDFMEQVGVVSEETKGRFIELGNSYVPFHKAGDIDPLDIRPDSVSLFERIKGGEGNIREVFENMTQHTNMMVDLAVRNLAKREVFRFIDRHGLGDIAQPVPAIQAKKLAELLKTQEKAAEAAEAAGDAAQAEALRAASETVSPEMMQLLKNLGLAEEGTHAKVLSQLRPVADQIDFVYENGQRKIYLLKDPVIAEAMQTFTPHAWQRTGIMMFGTRVSNLYRRGITMHPEFIARSTFKDTFSAYTQGSRTFRPGITSMRGLADALTQDENYWLMLVNGGGWNTRFRGQLAQNADLQTLYRVAGVDPARVIDSPRQAASALRKMASWKGVQRAIDLYERKSAAGETASRLGEFERVASATGDIREAAFRARENVGDFNVRGSHPAVKIFTALAPFSNPHIQGVRRFYGAFKENPARVAGRAAFTVMAPSMALHAMNMNDPRYRQLPNYIKDMHWVFFENDDPNAGYFLLPKPHDVGALFGTAPERIMDGIAQENGQIVADAMGGIAARALGVDMIPQAVKPLVELWANKSLFTGAPIVPKRLEDVKPSEQFDERTSTTARGIASTLGMSPKKLEHLVRGYFSMLGTDALIIADQLVSAAGGPEAPRLESAHVPFVSGFYRKQPSRNTQHLHDLYDFSDATTEAAATISKMLAEGREPTPGDRQQQLAALNEVLSGFKQAASDLREQRALVAFDKRRSRAERDREMAKIDRALNKLAHDYMSGLFQSRPEMMRRRGYVKPAPHAISLDDALAQ